MLLSRKGASFAVANVITFCLIIASVVHSTNTEGEETYDDSFLETKCTCGPQTLKCHFENDTKVCECDYKYRQEGEICTAYCWEDYQCDNGALCVNESCQCLPGTRGDFCKTVDECEGDKGPLKCGDPKDVFCRYDETIQKTYCHCSTLDYIYHAPTRKCIECDCGKMGTCSLVDGNKTCHCNEGTAVRRALNIFWELQDQCEVCDCGPDSDGCTFENLTDKKCNCTNDTIQQVDTCKECDCGPNGQCYFIERRKYCNCDKGYKTFWNGTHRYCRECVCGNYGECSFENGMPKCKCSPGYALREGKCTACQCYANDKIVNCTFTSKIQTCLCPEGYETGKFFCKDIDECALDGSNICRHISTVCVNTIGSYECKCKEGFEPYSNDGDPKIYGCRNIDECKEDVYCPPHHTVCTDLLGSYSCVCEDGYVPVHPNPSAKIAGCEKEMKKKENGLSGGTIVLIVVCVLICVCAVATIVFFRRKLVSRRDLGVEVSFHDMKKR